MDRKEGELPFWRFVVRTAFDLLLVGVFLSAGCWGFNSYMLNLELHGTSYESYEIKGRPLSLLYKVEDHHPSSSGWGLAYPRREIVERSYLWKQRWFEATIWCVFGMMGMYVLQRASGNHAVSILLPQKWIGKIVGDRSRQSNVVAPPSDTEH